MLIQRYRQKIIDKDKGDCFATCIACIIKCHQDYVPNFLKLSYESDNISPNYFVEQWLYRTGYRMIEVRDTSVHPRWCVDVPFIATLKSQKYSDGLHAVVGMLTARNRIVSFNVLHDPNPHNRPYGDVWPLMSTFIIKVPK